MQSVRNPPFPLSAGLFSWQEWDWDPLVVTGLVLSGLIWWWITQRWRPRHVQAWFGWSGLVVITLAVVSPLSHGAEVSFTLHMAQHLALMLLAAPLMALGVPAGLLGWIRRQSVLGALLRTVWSPLPAFALFHLALFAWHSPTLYNAAVRYEGVHLLQHASFLLGGLAFWGVIAAPEPPVVPAPLGQRLVMVLAANILGWALSFALAIAERPLYAVYTEELRPWGLSALTDMRLGGAVMWVAGNLVNGVAVMLLLFAMMRREARAGVPRV